MWHGIIFYTVKPWGVEPSSYLLSSENGGMRHSNVLLSCRSILNVPLSTSKHSTLSLTSSSHVPQCLILQFENSTIDHATISAERNKILTAIQTVTHTQANSRFALHVCLFNNWNNPCTNCFVNVISVNIFNMKMVIFIKNAQLKLTIWWKCCKDTVDS